MPHARHYSLLLAPWLLGCAAKPASGTDSAASRAVGQPESELLRGCTPTGPERCFNAVDDNCNGLLEEGCGIHGGIVQIVIAWDKPKADVDLNVIDPNGELIQTGKRARSGLVKERDCPGKGRSGCDGHNLENVYYPKTEPPRGPYKAIIVLERLGGESPPVNVAFAARLGNRTYSQYFELNDLEQEHTISLHL